MRPRRETEALEYADYNGLFRTGHNVGRFWSVCGFAYQLMRTVPVPA
jgi:hypothetical protein